MHRNARAPISLMFFICHMDKDKIIIPEEFEAPTTSIYIKPQKYQELEYREQPSKLRMEFYLQLLTHILITLVFMRYDMRKMTSTRANVIALLLQMNSLDVYCFSHIEDKQYYVQMVEVALTLDRKDFLADGYPVDEEVYPRVPPKLAGKKEKALASFSQVEEETMEEEEQEDVAEEENNVVNLSYDEIGAPSGSEPPLTGVHLTLPDVYVDILICRRNIMALQSLFGDDACVERP